MMNFERETPAARQKVEMDFGCSLVQHAIRTGLNGSAAVGRHHIRIDTALEHIGQVATSKVSCEKTGVAD
jgi:hypothetical protein